VSSTDHLKKIVTRNARNLDTGLKTALQR